MTCIVRKTLDKIGEVQEVSAIMTSQGKLTFDQMQSLVNGIEIQHARFLLKDRTPDEIWAQYKKYLNISFDLPSRRVLLEEISLLNEVIRRFPNAVSYYILSLAKSNANINISIVDLDPIDDKSLNATILSTNLLIDSISRINLRSICDQDKFCTFNRVEPVQVDTIVSLPEYKRGMTLEDLNNVVSICLQNASNVAIEETITRELIEKIYKIKECVKKLVESLSK